MERDCEVLGETMMYGEILRCMERDYDVWGETLMYG